jgi:segregation and condensation protein A
VTFQVRLEVFEGPLDLLLTLVRRETLEIRTLALARVTGQYLAYLRRLEEIDAGALASFCEVAASLILIKSRVLLPRRRETDEELEDDPDELAARLHAYAQYRSVAAQLGAREAKGLRAFARTAPPPPDLPPRVEPGEMSPDDLAAAFRKALAALAAAEEGAVAAPPPVRPFVVRIGDRLRAIGQRLRGHGRVGFLDVLTDGPRTREFVIVSFLAVLELLRRGAVRVFQDDLFGEIVIEGQSDAAIAAAGEEESFLDET